MFALQSVRVAAVATVSQLLNATALEDSDENNATLGSVKAKITASFSTSHI